MPYEKAIMGMVLFLVLLVGCWLLLHVTLGMW